MFLQADHVKVGLAGGGNSLDRSGKLLNGGDDWLVGRRSQIPIFYSAAELGRQVDVNSFYKRRGHSPHTTEDWRNFSSCLVFT